MSTRFYFPARTLTQPAPSSPDAAWDVVRSNLLNYKLRRSRAANEFAVADAQLSETSATAVNGLCCRYISEPLLAQTISGHVKGSLLVDEGPAGADMRAQMVIRVISEDGSTVRGTLLAADNASALSSEWSTTHQSRKFPLAASWDDPNLGKQLSPVVCQEGDRIVVELGFRAHNTTATSTTGVVRVGDASGTDLPETEGSGVGSDGWVEFSADLQFPPYDRGGLVFSDDFTGTDGAPWDPSKWTLSSQDSGSDPDIFGNEGRMQAAAVANSSSQAVAIMSDVLDTDVTVAFTFAETDADSVLLVWVRANGTWTGAGDRPDGPGLGAEWWNDRQQAKLIAQKANNDQVQEDQQNVRMPADTAQHWVRVRAVDGDIGDFSKLKFWTGTKEDEPADWDLEFHPADESYIAAAGVVQLVLNHESNGPFSATWDDLEVYDTAQSPTPPAPSNRMGGTGAIRKPPRS